MRTVQKKTREMVKQSDPEEVQALPLTQKSRALALLIPGALEN